MNPHHSNDASIKSTSVVKYLEILPSEPILEPTISPQIDLARLSVVQLDDITVQYYRQLYEATGSMVCDISLFWIVYLIFLANNIPIFV